MTPGTLGSSNSLTHTLSFGDSKLNVVLTQTKSSALAMPVAARKSTVAAINNLIADLRVGVDCCGRYPALSPGERMPPLDLPVGRLLRPAGGRVLKVLLPPIGCHVEEAVGVRE